MMMMMAEGLMVYDRRVRFGDSLGPYTVSKVGLRSENSS